MLLAGSFAALLPRVIGGPGGHRTGRLLFGAGRPEPTSDFDAVAVKDEKPIGRRIRIFEFSFRQTAAGEKKRVHLNPGGYRFRLQLVELRIDEQPTSR